VWKLFHNRSAAKLAAGSGRNQGIFGRPFTKKAVMKQLLDSSGIQQAGPTEKLFYNCPARGNGRQETD
jgi:hypothetical protein